MMQVTKTCFFCEKENTTAGYIYPAVVFAKGGDCDEQDWSGNDLISDQNDIPLIHLQKEWNVTF